MAKKGGKQRKVKKVKCREKARPNGNLTKQLMKICTDKIAEQIISSKEDISGRTPRGFAESLLQEARKSFPKMTMNMVNYAILKLKKERISSVITSAAGESNISSLTGSFSTSNKYVDDDIATASSSEASISSHTASSADDSSVSSSPSLANMTVSSDPSLANNSISSNENTQKKSLGRPKGSTDAAARSLEEQVKEATEEAAKMLKQSQQKLKSAKKRLRKGSLDDIISAAKKKHCVPDDVVICSETGPV